MSDREPRSVLRVEFLILCAAVLLVLCGAGAVGLWWVDADAIKARIDAASPDGTALSFPLERTRLVQERLAWYGIGLCAAGLAVLACHRRLAELVRQIAAELAAGLGEWRTGLGNWLRHERGHVLALGLFVVVAVCVRLAFVHQDMRFDEADSYLSFASRSLVFGLSEYPEPNNHLLSTLLMHVSVGLFGDAPWAVRLPTLIAGVLIVPATYWGLRGWLGRSPALIAAGLTAGSSYLVHYSVNARGYALVGLAFCLGLGLCARLVARPNRGIALVLGVVSALGFYAIPTMLFPFGACIVWLVLSALRQHGDGRSAARAADVVLACAVTMALTLVLYGPVLIVSGPGAVTHNKYVSATSWPQLLDGLGERLAIFGGELTRTPGIALLLGLGVVVWLALDLRRGARAVLLPLALVSWCAFVVLLHHTAPYGRVWTFAMPLCYGLGAAGLAAIVQHVARHRPAALAALALGLTAWMSWDTWSSRSPALSPEGERFEPAQDIAAFLQETIAFEDRILSVTPVRPSLWYYMQRAGFPAEIMSHDPGGPAFTYAVVALPLERFDDGLREWNLPPLGPGRLRPVREFPGALVCRIEPPLPH